MFFYLVSFLCFTNFIFYFSSFHSLFVSLCYNIVYIGLISFCYCFQSFSSLYTRWCWKILSLAQIRPDVRILFFNPFLIWCRTFKKSFVFFLLLFLCSLFVLNFCFNIFLSSFSSKIFSNFYRIKLNVHENWMFNILINVTSQIRIFSIFSTASFNSLPNAFLAVESDYQFLVTSRVQIETILLMILMNVTVDKLFANQVGWCKGKVISE